MKSFYFKRDPGYDTEYGKKDWLYINNFGYYAGVTKDISTERALPRADYHLLYVSSGEIRINGATLRCGDAYLLMPYDPHFYTYKKADNSRYYWIHFTGNKASEVLSHAELVRGINRANERKREKDAVLGMITEELLGCSEEASEYAVSLFFSFLSLFKSGKERRRHYAEAVRALEATGEDVEIAQLAGLYNISPSHFIRSFKAAHGVTPNEYRQNYRISKAISLLKMTNLSVQDIAEQCGFEDPLYFSRIFKKRIGVSPSVYRKGK